MVSGAQVSSVGIGHLQLQSTAVAHVDIQVFFCLYRIALQATRDRLQLTHILKSPCTDGKLPDLSLGHAETHSVLQTPLP